MSKKTRGARYIAIEILNSLEESRLPVDQLMEQHIAAVRLADPRDRQLIMSLVYGVLRWRNYLDWIIGQFSTHPLAKIKKKTLQALRVGVLQLLFLDRVPASAAINETVQALKDMKQPKWLTGFVNGLLRSIARSRHDLPHPIQAEDSGALPEAALLNHPPWLVNRWKKRYGVTAATRICLANNSQPPLCLRVNTSLTTPAALLNTMRSYGLNVAAGRYSPAALRITGYQGAVKALPGFARGFFQVQDEAAQLVTLLLGPLQPGKTYLDGCAGLGGKTSHLAQMLPPASQLVAVEPHPDRIKKMQENLDRLRLDTRVTIVEGTLDALLPDGREKFTGVLIDAPCSGLGVIRRHPDIRWNRRPEDLHRYQAIQLDLLKNAAQLVCWQGTLVYATCSTEPEENEAVIHKFLASQPQFIMSDCRDLLPGSGADLIDRRGFFRTLPDRKELDGFFAARLTKKH